jgi:hypothetical protein
MINVWPARYVSPLCNAIYRNELPAIDGLVKHGAKIDMEGAGEGSARPLTSPPLHLQPNETGIGDPNIDPAINESPQRTQFQQAAMIDQSGPSSGEDDLSPQSQSSDCHSVALPVARR